MGSTEAMKQHRAERAGVNTEERKRLPRNARLGADAGVCPEQANTQEKTLAMAGLVRDCPSSWNDPAKSLRMVTSLRLGPAPLE